MKVADVIQMNYMLIPVIHRFGIELGFGDKTITEVCEENNVDLNFFLQFVNAYHSQDYFPDEKLQNISVHEIISYLKMTHTSYLDNAVTDIEQKIKRIELEGKEDNKYITLIKNFFEGYKLELTEHITREEDVVFPYVLTVDEIIKTKSFSEKTKKIFEEFSIEEYKEDHDDVEEKLMDLLTIMTKYVTPPSNVALYHSIIHDLFRLKEDLNYHARIENKVLIPKIFSMEKLIKNMF